MKKKNFPEPLEALVLILVLFSGMLLLAVTIGFILSLTGQASAQLDRNIQLFFFFGESLFLIIPWLYARKRGYNTTDLFRLKKVPLQSFAWAFLMGLGLIILTDELERVITLLIPIPDAIKELMKPMIVNGPWEWFAVFTGSVIFAAIAEEGLFRGFMQVTLEARGDVTRAVVLASVSWTIIHMNPYWAIQIFIMGVFLGWLAWRLDSIWPSVLIHGMNNFLALIIINSSIDEDIPWYTYQGHVSPLFLIAGGLLLYGAIRAINRLPRPVRTTYPS